MISTFNIDHSGIVRKTLTYNDGVGKSKVPIREGYIPTPKFTGAHYEFSIKGIVETSDDVGLA
jgi:hypothetical protein